jgi:hypothetical protein
LLVADATAVVVAGLSEAAFIAYTKEGLTEPHLLWSEAASVVHDFAGDGRSQPP